jgi:hypothetical protein
LCIEAPDDVLEVGGFAGLPSGVDDEIVASANRGLGLRETPGGVDHVMPCGVTRASDVEGLAGRGEKGGAVLRDHCGLFLSYPYKDRKKGDDWAASGARGCTFVGSNLGNKEYSVMNREQKRSEGIAAWQEAILCWEKLEPFREKMKYSIQHAFEDQWGDNLTVFNEASQGYETIKESDQIYRQGRTPLKNNLIRPIMKNIEGQYRSLPSSMVCIPRTLDPQKERLQELGTRAVEYIGRENQVAEVDAQGLTDLMLSGFCAQRIEYGQNAVTQKDNVWISNCNPNNVFFNLNQEDSRGWDTRIIGEFFEMPMEEILYKFSQGRKEEDQIAQLYKEQAGKGGVLPEKSRVYCVWKKQWSVSEEGKEEKEQPCWYYRYLTSWGEVLKEGKSPYVHKSHNYEVCFYPLVRNGEIYNLVGDLIDIQKVLNRTVTEVNARLMYSMKGLKIYDAQMFPDISAVELAVIASKSDGLLPAQVTPGKTIREGIIQCDPSVNMSNDFQLIETQLQLINDVSGVNAALQGKSPTAGTSASLYAQESQNGTLNTRGLLDTFRAFTLRRCAKALKTAQQYFPEGLLLPPSKVGGATLAWEGEGIREVEFEVRYGEAGEKES